jgi:hypothetical protein
MPKDFKSFVAMAKQELEEVVKEAPGLKAEKGEVETWGRNFAENLVRRRISSSQD